MESISLNVWVNLTFVGVMVASIVINNRSIKQQIQYNREDVNRQIMLNSKIKTVSDLRELTSKAMVNYNEFNTEFEKIVKFYKLPEEDENKINTILKVFDNYKSLFYTLDSIRVFISTSDFQSNSQKEIKNQIENLFEQLEYFRNNYFDIDDATNFPALKKKRGDIGNKFLAIYNDLKVVIEKEQQYIDNPAYLFENHNGD